MLALEPAGMSMKAMTIITATARETPTTVETDLILSPSQPPTGAPMKRVPYWRKMDRPPVKTTDTPSTLLK